MGFEGLTLFFSILFFSIGVRPTIKMVGEKGGVIYGLLTLGVYLLPLPLFCCVLKIMSSIIGFIISE